MKKRQILVLALASCSVTVVAPTAYELRRTGGVLEQRRNARIRRKEITPAGWIIQPAGLAPINKGRHVGQPAFSELFALLSLAGASPPASKRTKIPRKSKAVRCEAVLREQKCPQTMKSPQRILYVFSRALRKYEGISAPPNRGCPCQSTL